MIAYHCDNEECDSWLYDLDDMVIVTIEGEDLHFCCGWCMIKWGANIFEPTEVITKEE